MEHRDACNSFRMDREDRLMATEEEQIIKDCLQQSANLTAATIIMKTQNKPTEKVAIFSYIAAIIILLILAALSIGLIK
jgi:hypothetical protein